MDRWQSQFAFWNSFGVPAYEQSAVPDLDDVDFPYITYPAMTAPFGGDTVASPSIWTRSPSWLEADALADTIEQRLKNGGEVVLYDGGMIWVTAETPFAQSMGDPNDDLIKRKVLTIGLHFA